MNEPNGPFQPLPSREPSNPAPFWRRALPYVLALGAVGELARHPWLAATAVIASVLLIALSVTGRVPWKPTRSTVGWLLGGACVTTLLTLGTCASSTDDVEATDPAAAATNVADVERHDERADVPSNHPQGEPMPAAATSNTTASPEPFASWVLTRPPLAKFDERVAFDVAVESLGTVTGVAARRGTASTSGGGLRVLGRTNLPDGTRLIASVAGGPFSGQASSDVSGGTFAFGPFGRRGVDGEQTLPAGRYAISVTAHAAQPPALRDVLGPDGDRMRGPLVRRTSFGRVAEWSGAFVVEGTPPPAFRGPETVRKVAQLIDAGRALEGFRRDSDEIGNAQACGARMRALLAEVDAVERDVALAPAVGNADALRVRGALGNLRLCVVCAPSAMQHCSLATAALDGR